MNNNIKNFIGEIVKIDNKDFYIQVTSNDFSNSLIFHNEVLTQPNIGSFIKANEQNQNYIFKIVGESYINKNSQNIRIWKCRLYGSYNSNYQHNFSSYWTPNLGTKVSLISNLELSEINKFKPETGEFINNFGKIKHSDAEFYLNTNFFTSDVLYIGDKEVGKTQTVSTIYKNLFKRFLSSFESEHKFIFFDYKNEYSKLLSSNFLKANLHKIKKFNIKPKLKSTEIITLKKILNILNFSYDEMCLFAQVETNIQQKFINDFYDELHFKQKTNYLEDIFVHSTFNTKALTLTKQFWNNLFQDHKQDFKIAFSTLESIIDLYSNTFYEGELIILKQYLLDNKTKFKEYFDYKAIKKHNSAYISIDQKTFLIILNRAIKSKKLESTTAFKRELTSFIESNVNFLIKTKLIFTVAKNQETYFELNALVEKFNNSWLYAYDLFVSLIDINQEENVIIVNFSNLNKRLQETFTLIYLKLFLNYKKLFEHKNSYFNFVIDDNNHLFWNENLNQYEAKYKKETIELFIARKANSMLHLSYITNSITNMDLELLSTFDNVALFSTKNLVLKDYLMTSLKYNFIERFEVDNLQIGEMALMGKNVNLPVIINFNKIYQKKNLNQTQDTTFLGIKS